MKDWFDFSDYPKIHPLYDESNKKVIGKFKDELNGKQMVRLVALKPKRYAFEIEGGEEKKKSKGVKKNITKTLTVDDYKQTLFDNKTIRKEQYMIHSQKHQIHTIKQNKVALNESKEQTESKRFICMDKVKTLAFGHYKL